MTLPCGEVKSCVESTYLKVVIPGGTGEVGSILAKTFLLRGHEVVILTRQKMSQPSGKLSFVNWDAESLGEWTEALEGSDAIINLAGRTVNCRYTDDNKKLIKDSRVKSTQIIGEAIAQLARPPKAWLQMSTATIYAHTFERSNDEYFGIIGGDEPNVPESWRFSIEVARAWEEAQDQAPISKFTRRIKMRTSIVMSPHQGGPFDILLRLVRMGLGGPSGSGNQFISWISDVDFANAVYFLLEQKEFSGAVNLASPNPLPNRDFMRVLREAWGAPFGLPASEWMLEMGAVPLQTETELVLKSRKVHPAKLLQAKFPFEYPYWEDAAVDLCYRWKQEQKVKAG